MKKLIAFAVCCLSVAVCWAQEHPRLFGKADDFAAVRERTKSDELAKLTADKIIRAAQEVLPLPVCERKQEGRRILYVSREVLWRVSHLGMAYQLTGDKVYAERGAKEMRAAAAFSNWNPSHFLDTAEMTLALAIGYDWLYQALTPDDREVILDGIIKKGLDASETGEHWWIKAHNNWGQVCHAGMLSGALLLREKDPERMQRLVKRTVDNLPIAMGAFAPKGGFPEGPMYWEYAMDFNVLALDLLEQAQGNDSGLSKLPGFQQTGDYLNVMTGPSELPFGYADARPIVRETSGPMWWFAKRYNRPDIVAPFELAALRRYCASDQMKNRLFPFVLLWYRSYPPNAEIQAPLAWRSGDGNEAAVHRTSWDKENSTFAGIKAGRPMSAHAHMDCGSFVLDRYGMRWVHDLGLEEYNNIEQLQMNLWGTEQGSDRWKIFRLGNKSHNMLIINDEPQRATGVAKIIDVTDDGRTSEISVDLTKLFPVASRVVRKSVLFRDGAYEVRDEVKAPAGTKVRWQVAVRAPVHTFTGSQEYCKCGGNLVLKQNGKQMMLTALHNKNIRWQVEPTDALLKSWDAPNPGVSLVWFEETVPDSGELKLAVRFD